MGWLWDFVGMFTAQAVGFFAVAFSLFGLTRGTAWLARWRIEPGARRLTRAQVIHEVLHSLVALALGTGLALAVNALREGRALDLPDTLGSGGVVGAMLTVIALVAFNDLWFYGIHRLLHTPWLYRHVHAVHHRSVDVSPLSAYSFHGVEALALTAWVVPVLPLVPVPLPVLATVQVLGTTNNLMAHLGFELLPAWWLRVPGLRWSNTATFHSLHHTRFRGNYGLFTRVWDHLFGTALDGYEEAFAAAHRPAAPPSPDPQGADVA